MRRWRWRSAGFPLLDLGPRRGQPGSVGSGPLDESPQADVRVVAGRHDVVTRALKRGRADVQHGDALAEIPVG